MDLKALISKSTSKIVQPVPVPTPDIRLVEDSRVAPNTVEILTDKAAAEFVLQANEVCACGHPQDAHGEAGDCEILECECTSFCPPSHAYDINTSSPAPSTDVSAPCASGQGSGPVVTSSVTSAPSASLGGLIEEFDKRVGTPQATSTEILQLPEPDKDMMPEGYCQHLCDCGKWWTHGAAHKCRYPDVLKQGACQDCLKGKTDQMDVSEELKDGKLTPIAQIKTRNDERVRCKDMSIEQLTYHIEFLAQQIEALRVRSLESRKMRSELEEEELANIPESEREKFLQELRLGSKTEKKTRKPRAVNGTGKVKKVSQADQIAATKTSLVADGVPPGIAENMASLMIRLGKSRAEVEAFLND